MPARGARADRDFPEDGIRRRPPCAPGRQDRAVGKIAAGPGPDSSRRNAQMTETRTHVPPSRPSGPRDLRGHPARNRPAGRAARADRQRELHVRGRARSHRQRLHQQVRGRAIPGKRYYGGCEFTDIVENLARERAKKLFGAEYVNVQPHSGSQANQAAYAAVLAARRHHHGLEPGARRPPHARPPAQLLRQDCTRWCRTTCARKTSASTTTKWSGWPRSTSPRLIIAGASAYPRIIDFARFRQIADLRGRGVPGGHGAHLRTGGGGRASEPLRVRRHRHLHYAQDAARPARRHDSGAANGTARTSTRTSFPARRAGRWCT